MKKTLITFLIVLLVSCSTEQDKHLEDSLFEDSLAIENVNYILDGKTLKVDFLVSEDDELIVVENESSVLVERFISEHENYIEYHIDEANIVLLRDDLELDNYLKAIGNPLNTSESSSSRSANDPYQRGNLELYYKCCFDDRGYFDWISICDVYDSLRHCADGQEVARLKDFTNPSLWSSLRSTQCSTSICNPLIPDRIYPFGDPDNQLESVLVRNVFARFYEHTNYGGKSIVLDARGGQEKGHRKLRQVKDGLFGRGWKDRISSIRLSN